MEVQLREMSMEEFKVFSENSIFDYANDLVKSSGITMDEALIQAQEEFAGMLPNALETKNNILRVIVDVSEQKTVGVIWYLFEVTDGVKQIFLNDFIIKEEERRKGYASAALIEMERDAQKMVVQKALFMFGSIIHRESTYIPNVDMLHLGNWMMECT